MREEIRDKDRLLHIQEAIQDIFQWEKEGIIAKIGPKTIEFHGLAKRLEVIGEASYMLSKVFKEKHPMTPWNSITAMRHLIVHGYYTTELEEMRNIIKDDLPDLHRQIEEYLKELA